MGSHNTVRPGKTYGWSKDIIICIPASVSYSPKFIMKETAMLAVCRNPFNRPLMNRLWSNFIMSSPISRFVICAVPILLFNLWRHQQTYICGEALICIRKPSCFNQYSHKKCVKTATVVPGNQPHFINLTLFHLKHLTWERTQNVHLFCASQNFLVYFKELSNLSFIILPLFQCVCHHILWILHNS
jgi:hypothetical protein